MIYIVFFCIAIVAITITKFAVPFILSKAKIPYHLVATVNFLLNIVVLLSTFFVLLFLLQAIGIGGQPETTIHQLKDEKAGKISKKEEQLTKEKEQQRRLQEELEAEKRHRIERKKQQRLLSDGQVKSPPEFEGEKIKIGPLRFQLLLFSQNF